MAQVSDGYTTSRVYEQREVVIGVGPSGEPIPNVVWIVHTESVAWKFLMARKRALLTPRQGDLLVLLTEGLPNKEIAWRLGLSLESVKSMLAALYRRMAVSNRVQAAGWALLHPWLVPRRAAFYEFPIGV